VVDDDPKWFAMLHDLFQHFKYQNIMTEDIVAYMNQYTGMHLTPIFDQYLRHTAIPTLELKFEDAARTVSYRWKADVSGFAMPVRVGTPGSWQTVNATTGWQTMTTPVKKSEFQVAEDLYYVNVEKE
jgi:aminopeptidase N